MQPHLYTYVKSAEVNVCWLFLTQLHQRCQASYLKFRKACAYTRGINIFPEKKSLMFFSHSTAVMQMMREEQTNHPGHFQETSGQKDIYAWKQSEHRTASPSSTSHPCDHGSGLPGRACLMPPHTHVQGLQCSPESTASHGDGEKKISAESQTANKWRVEVGLNP